MESDVKNLRVGVFSLHCRASLTFTYTMENIVIKGTYARSKYLDNLKTLEV